VFSRLKRLVGFSTEDLWSFAGAKSETKSLAKKYLQVPARKTESTP